MDVIKLIFSWLVLFLQNARAVMLNLGTAFVLIGITVAIIGGISSSTKDVTDPAGRVLILDPQGVIIDQEVSSTGIGLDFSGGGGSEQIQTRDFVALIQAIAKDENIPAVLIDFSKTDFAGPTTAINVAKELKALRDSGKRVIAFSDQLSTSSYLMASQATEIWVHPVGSLSVSGIGGMRPYQKDLFENLKVNFHNYSQGDFKSAMEGLTRSDMSEFSRLQMTELLVPIWAEMKDLMASGRGIDESNIQHFADNYIGFIGEAAIGNIAYAQENNIIDGTKSFPEFRHYMIENFGKDEEAKTDTYKYITYQDYESQIIEDESESDNEIAVVTAEGVITEGDISPGVAGSSGMVELIRKAHENENTKAIVFRVNSPGGSIIASEMMRDELFEAKRKGIKVIVSMGDYAASGGVYIATPADYIFAEPTTITGSIGVAIAFPTLENTMDYIGVNFDGVVTSKYAGWTPTQATDEELDKFFESWGADAYARFVGFVAESRSQSYEDINTIAGGRVWIATRAYELGLVDEIGGIDAAINYAVAQTEVDGYKVKYYSQELSSTDIIIQQLLKSFDMSAVNPTAFSIFNSLVDVYENLVGIKKPQVLLTCESCLVDID